MPIDKKKKDTRMPKTKIRTKSLPLEIIIGGNFVTVGFKGYEAWTGENHSLGGPLELFRMHVQYPWNDAKMKECIEQAQRIVAAVHYAHSQGIF